jgi:poly(beta-D-mannuronate) lyase
VPAEPSPDPSPDAHQPSPGDRVTSIELANWKLQLPVGEKEKPTEISQPELAHYQSKWFQREPSGALRFRAPVNGVTTSGSKNPRSELREVTPTGEKAAWSTSGGTHTMVIDEAITELPEGKPQIVAGQVHGTSDDLTVFRLEGSKLYVTNGDDTHHFLVDGNYKLGTRFQASFVAGGGEIKAYYNGQLKTTIKQASDTAYFKAGAYTQANCSNVDRCEEANAGEVVIYGLTVTQSS